MEKQADYMDEISEYIKKNLKKGYTKDSLKWALIGQGHSKMEVEKAMKKVEIELAKRAPILNTRPEIKMEIVEPNNAWIEKRSWWKRILGIS